MTRNKQKELLKETTNELFLNECQLLIKHIIENSDKKHRDMIEQYLMDNDNNEYVRALEYLELDL